MKAYLSLLLLLSLIMLANDKDYHTPSEILDAINCVSLTISSDKKVYSLDEKIYIDLKILSNCETLFSAVSFCKRIEPEATIFLHLLIRA